MLDEKFVADVIYGGILSEREVFLKIFFKVIFIRQYYGLVPSIINILPSKLHDFVLLFLGTFFELLKLLMP